VPTARQHLQTIRILHLALSSTLVIYGVVAFVAFSSREPGFQPPPSTLLYVLAGVAASVLFVVTPIMHQRFMPPRDRTGDGRPFDPDELTHGNLMDRIRVGLILTWSLCEATAINGLIAAILYREPLYYVPFAVAAAGGMVFYAPRQAMFEAIARANRG